MAAPKILLVDDEPKVLNALKLRLGKDYRVTVSSNPQEALNIARDKGPFPVIMSDLRMPEMNGIQFLENVEKISPSSSKILLTGQGIYEDAVKAVNSGKVFKYLAKPCNKLDITKALEEGIEHYHKEVEKKYSLQEYGKENSVARIVQDQLLFSDLPIANKRVDFAAQSTPRRHVCGDFFEIVPYSEDCFDVIIADVMGKGLPAALIGAATKHVLVREAQRIFARQKVPPKLSSLLQSVEQEMYAKLNQTKTYVTLCLMRVDLRKNMISYISCGHPGTVLLREGTPEIFYLKGRNMPIGIIEGAEYEAIEFEYKNNDQLILYTDGIVDALNEWADLDPVEAILDCLEGDEKDSAAFVKNIFNKAENKVGEKDDMTVLAMKLTMNNESSNGFRKSSWLQRSLDEIYRLNSIPAEIKGGADDLFKVAAIETFTNIVRHSKSSKSAIKVFLDRDKDGRSMVYFQYEGEFFKPELIKLPDCSNQHDGFGLFLVERICQSVEYFKNENNQNCICLIAKKESDHVC